MVDLVLMQPADLDRADTEPLSQFQWRFLAEGDSWFSMGALNPFTSANLLQQMAFARRCVAVNCALPGDTLQRMVNVRRDPVFVSLLAGATQRRWDALLFSAGGNDLIDALSGRLPGLHPRLRGAHAATGRHGAGGPLAAAVAAGIRDSGR